MKKLTFKTIKVSDLNLSQKNDMFEVFSKYYNNISKEAFEKDLNDKDIVFLLLDKQSLRIVGFSTLLNIFVKVNGKSIRGVFSGDTILEKQYWGNGTLGLAFLRYLFIQKLKNPFKPLYWYLISKGFKTYLMMANNFKNHFPRYEFETPSETKDLISAFSRELYPKNYCSQSGLLKFKGEESKDSLKGSVAPITKDMIKNHPRIKFFADKNSGWEKGDELCCLAKMELLLPLRYQVKVIKKIFNKNYKLVMKKINYATNYIFAKG